MEVVMGYVWKQEWAIYGSSNRLYMEVVISYIWKYKPLTIALISSYESFTLRLRRLYKILRISLGATRVPYKLLSIRNEAFRIYTYYYFYIKKITFLSIIGSII